MEEQNAGQVLLKIDQQASTVDNANSVEKAENDNTNSFGKFKSAEELLNAYIALEKEFTRRSQRLKTLERVVEQQTDAQAAQYESQDWKQKTEVFFAANPSAKVFAGEIAEEIISGGLDNNPYCLEIALARVLLKNYRSPSSLMIDSEFLNNYVFNNAEVREKVISDYLAKMSDVRPPDIIGGGGRSAVTPPYRPRSLREAGELAKRIFK